MEDFPEKICYSRNEAEKTIYALGEYILPPILFLTFLLDGENVNIGSRPYHFTIFLAIAIFYFLILNLFRKRFLYKICIFFKKNLLTLEGFRGEKIQINLKDANFKFKKNIIIKTNKKNFFFSKTQSFIGSRAEHFLKNLHNKKVNPDW